MKIHTQPDPHDADQFTYLENLTARGIRSDLSVMHAALRLMGDPQEQVPTVIVSGTNGKGSVTAMIGNIIRHAEYSVGCYYSPHILDVRERITLNGRIISMHDMAELIGYVRGKTERHLDLTYFEFLTLAAYYWFAEKKADLAVMEVGMGGRFDATNVTRPVVSVITTVSLDHTQYLGKTVEVIAEEKAQIVPPGGILVVGRVKDTVKHVLREEAKSRRAGAFFLGDDFSANTVRSGERHAEGAVMRYRGMGSKIDDILVPLAGAHQLDNAAVAIAAVEMLGRKSFSIPGRSVKEGIASVRLPGRMERVAENPEVIVDVAHNPDAARVLADYIESVPKKRTALVVGMMSDKDIGGFLAELESLADVIFLAPPHVGRAAPVPALKEAASSLNKPVRVEDDIAAAVIGAVDAVGEGGRVVVTGSFYTVQEAMRHIHGLRRTSVKGG